MIQTYNDNLVRLKKSADAAPRVLFGYLKTFGNVKFIIEGIYPESTTVHR
jgi:hypothetical protein